MAFNPDEYLNEKGTSSTAKAGFDPDAYLSESKKPAATFDPDAYLSETKTPTVGGLTVPPAPEVPKFEARKPEEGILRPVADPFLNIGAGINDVLKGFSDAFGANNAVSQNLAKNSEWYRSLLSAGAKEDAEEIGRIMQEAEGQGVLAEIGAGLKALTVAPIDLVSQGIGSLIPFIATAGVGKAVGLSKAGVAVLQGVQGGAVGGGIVKGEIYDAVKEQLINSGVDEDKAEKAASEAQSYNGKNLDQILLGTGLGVAASATGAEGAIRSLITRKVGQEAAEQVSERAIQEVLRTGFVRGAVKDGIVETATEALQGGQERLAANVALGREGFDVEPMRGVLGQATLEGALGGVLGGAAGGISAKAEQLGMRESVALRDAAKAADEAKQSNAPASAAVVEEQIERVGETLNIPATVTPRREGETDQQWRARIERERAETPDQRVARLRAEATAEAGIELEEEPPVSGTPPQPVTPTPEVSPAATEPAVEPAVTEPQPAVEVAAEPVAPTEPAAAEPSPAVAPRPAVDVEALSPNAKRANRILNNAGVDPETAAFVAQQYQDEIADLGGEELRAFVLDKFEENGGVIPAQMRYSEDQEYYEMAFGIVPEEAATLVENAKGQNAQMAQAELEQNKQWRRKDEQAQQTQQGVAVAQPEAQAVPLPAGEVPPSPVIEGRRVPIAAPEAEVAPVEPVVEPVVAEPPPVTEVAPTEVDPQVAAQKAIDASRLSGRRLGIGRASESVEQAREVAYEAKQEASLSKTPVDKAIQIWEAAGNETKYGEPEFASSDLSFAVSGGYDKSTNEVKLTNNPKEFSSLTGDAALTPRSVVRHELGHWALFNAADNDLVSRLFEWSDSADRTEILDPWHGGRAGIAYPKTKFDSRDELVSETYSIWKSGGTVPEAVIPMLQELDALVPEQLQNKAIQFADSHAAKLGVAPETPNLEPLRRVARAEQTEEDVSGLVGQGLVELYNGQPVITQAGLEALPEVERPRLNPEARKIQIDTGSNEVVAEAIAKGLRIGVDQVGTGVRMPAGWTLVEDIYVPPKKMERIDLSDVEALAEVDEDSDVFADVIKRKDEAKAAVVQKPEGSAFANQEEFRAAFDLRGEGHGRFATRLDLMVADGAITSEGQDLIMAVIFDNKTNDEFLANMEMGSLRPRVSRAYGRGGASRQTVETIRGKAIGYKPSLRMMQNARKGLQIDEQTAETLSTFWHEFGHAGYYSLLDKAQKGKIASVYNKTTKTQREKFFESGVAAARQADFYSRYYAKSESEWFAQSFAEYVLTKKSEQKALVPIFESILNKVKNIFGKLFSRKEGTPELEDIFEYIIQGKDYGSTKIWWNGMQMSLSPAIYGVRGAQPVDPAFSRRLIEREKQNRLRARTAPELREEPAITGEATQMVAPEAPEPQIIEDVWKTPEQEITSARTSINERKLPAVFNKVKEWVSGTINADIGGGRFDNATNWLRDRGVTNLIIDWFNRDRAFNEANIERVRGGQADTATASNVLNVIQEPEARDLVIRQAADAIKEDGMAYFYIYEGDKSGTGKQTASGWQENRRTQDYIDEISQHFEDVTRQGQMIVARNPIKGEAIAMEAVPPEKIPTFSEGSPEASTLSTMAASMAKVDAASEAKGPTTYKISEIASIWMDQGGDTRQLQDLISENTNLTPANAKKVANAIAKQYDIQQSIATAFLETQTGLSVEALPEGVTLPKEVDPDRPRPVMQRLFDVFMGVKVKPVKITVNEKTALNQQIRLKAAATREAKKAQQETANEVVEIIKAMELRGPVRPKQAQALAKRAAKVIWTSEKSIESFTDYAAKVVENTNYDADVQAARDAQKRAKALSTQPKIAMSPQRGILESIGKIAVNRLDDPRMFAEMINYYLGGFKAVTSPDYIVVPDSEIKGYISSAKDEEIQSQRELDRAVNLRLAEKYGVDPEEVNEVLAAFDVIKEIEANENREAIDNLLTEKAIETRDGLRAYDSTPLRQDQRKVVDAMAKVDPAALDAEERQRFIRIANNVIFNNQTNGAEYFMSVANGQQNARIAAQDSEMVSRNKAWVNLLPTFGSISAEKTMRGWALELQSVSDTFRNAFGLKSMAKIYKAMGMLDLNSSFTQANNTIDQIQEEMAGFHNKLEKDYGATSRNQDGLLAEGVAGFLIQRVPQKDDADSIAQRRDLIRQDISNRRQSGELDRVAMADRIETILNQIDGTSTQDVLDKLKKTYRPNYDSLIWYKDTLLPKYKDFLKNFDENFNDQANNYDNPNYLPIAFNSAGPSLAITKEEEQVFYDQVSLRPKQSANTIKRVDYSTLPKDRTTGTPKEIEFNLRRSTFNSLSDQINKAYTSGAWQQIASFMKTPESTQVFGGQANKDFFVDRLNRLRLSRMRRGAMSRGAFEKAADAVGVISRKLGTGIALGGVYQWIKQPPDQLVTAWGSGARGEVLARNIAPSNQKAARTLLNKFSIGRRGDASAGYKYINQMEGHQNRLERYFSESKWDQAKEQAGKIADVWMIGLKKSDFIAASAAWMTYYETELNKRNIQITDWNKESELIDGDNNRQEAAAYAEQMTDIYQGSSDPTQMAVFAQSGKSGAENLLKAMFVPFNSFAVQQRMRLYSDVRDVLSGDKRSRGGLAGTIGGLILFHATKRYVLPVISGSAIGVLYSLMGVDVEEPDEEKQKEQASKNFRQFLADASSNLLVGGMPQVIESQLIKSFNYAAYLTAMQLEDESVMGDDGELISFDKYQKERSPLYRYQTYGGAMSLGMLEIGFDQAKQVALSTKMVASEEEMETFTPEEKRLLYFSALSDWLYLMRLNDTDFARLVQKARRDMIKSAEEREKELARIRAGR